MKRQAGSTRKIKSNTEIQALCEPVYPDLETALDELGVDWEDREYSKVVSVQNEIAGKKICVPLEIYHI